METNSSLTGGLPLHSSHVGQVMSKSLVDSLQLSEKDGFVYAEFLANGWTGAEWERWYGQNKYPLSERERSILNSAEFVPTPAGKKINAVIMKGVMFPKGNRKTVKIQECAIALGFRKSKMDIACLFTKAFTNSNLVGLGLDGVVVMSDFDPNSPIDQYFLGVASFGDGDCQLMTYCNRKAASWHERSGFLFEYD